MPSRKKSIVKKYQALCCWDEGDLQEFLDLKPNLVKNAIVRDGAISFDWVSIGNDNEMAQTTSLSSTDGVHYNGTTNCLPGFEQGIAPTEAVLYSNSKGHLLLGQMTWAENGSTESFIIQLHGEKVVEGVKGSTGIIPA